MRLENEGINHKINIQQQQIKIKKLETQDIIDKITTTESTQKSELEKSTKELEQKQQKLKQKQKELEESKLELINNNIVLEKLSEKLDLIKNISFTQAQDLVNTINNRNRKNKNNSLNSLNKRKKKVRK